MFPGLQQGHRHLTAVTGHAAAQQQAQPAHQGMRQQGGVLRLLAADGLSGMRAGSHTAASLRHSRSLSSSTQGSHTEAATAATDVLPLSSAPGSGGGLNALQQDVGDTLTLAACIRRFRSRGHLVSQLDPLKRTPGGPWLGPIGDAYTR